MSSGSGDSTASAQSPSLAAPPPPPSPINSGNSTAVSPPAPPTSPPTSPKSGPQTSGQQSATDHPNQPSQSPSGPVDHASSPVETSPSDKTASASSNGTTAITSQRMTTLSTPSVTVVEATIITTLADGESVTTSFQSTTTLPAGATIVASAARTAKDPHTRAVVGGVLGSLAFLTLLGIGVWLFHRRRKQMQEKELFDGNFDPAIVSTRQSTSRPVSQYQSTRQSTRRSRGSFSREAEPTLPVIDLQEDRDSTFTTSARSRLSSLTPHTPASEHNSTSPLMSNASSSILGHERHRSRSSISAPTGYAPSSYTPPSSDPRRLSTFSQMSQYPSQLQEYIPNYQRAHSPVLGQQNQNIPQQRRQSASYHQDRRDLSLSRAPVSLLGHGENVGEEDPERPPGIGTTGQ